MSNLAIIHNGPPLGDWIEFTKSSKDEYFLIHSEKRTIKPFHIQRPEIWYTFKYEFTPEFIQGVLRVITIVSFINLEYEVMRCDIRDLSSNPEDPTLIFEVVDIKNLKQKEVETLHTTLKKCSQGFSEQMLIRFSLDAAITDIREDILIEMLKFARLHPNHLMDGSRIDQDHSVDRGDTILAWAVKQNLIYLVDVLLLFKILKINAQNKDGETALMIAARLGHITILQKLLENRRINPNITDPAGETAFSKSATEGHLEVVEVFLKTPAVKLHVQAENGKTPLMKAIEGGHFDIACRMISQIKNLQQLGCEDKEGHTAFSLISSDMDGLKEIFKKKEKELQEMDEYQVITEEELQETPIRNSILQKNKQSNKLYKT